MSTQLTWYGHATLGLKTGGYSLLVDPFFTGNPAASDQAANMQADFILVTHGHGDHVGDTLAIAKRCDALVISNAEISTWLGKQGVRNARAAPGRRLPTIPSATSRLTMALARLGLPDGSYGGNPGGFLLTTHDGQKIYLAGDTGLFGDMGLIGEEELDLAVLPIGDNYTMGPSDALRAVKLLAPEARHPNSFQHL